LLLVSVGEGKAVEVDESPEVIDSTDGDVVLDAIVDSIEDENNVDSGASVVVGDSTEVVEIEASVMVDDTAEAVEVADSETEVSIGVVFGLGGLEVDVTQRKYVVCHIPSSYALLEGVA